MRETFLIPLMAYIMSMVSKVNSLRYYCYIVITFYKKKVYENIQF